MIVKCIAELPTREQAKWLGGHYRGGKQAFGVVLGMEYIVFALTVLGGEPWVEITDADLDPGYLWGVPLCLFEIVIPRLSVLWEAPVAKNGELRLEPASLSRRNYHDDLFEGVEEVVADFRRVRQALEEEADLHRRSESSRAVLS